MGPPELHVLIEFDELQDSANKILPLWGLAWIGGEEVSRTSQERRQGSFLFVVLLVLFER